MKEITRSHDSFKLNLMQQLLESEGIYAIIMDAHVGGLYHGIGNMYPRLMVSDDDVQRALEIIQKAEWE